MGRSNFFYATLVAVLFVNLFGVEAAPSRTRMRDVETLLFVPGKMTEVHRGAPVPQMECVGGSGATHADKVRAIACKNAGWDGTQVIWKCETELPDGLEIGDFTVICEGWQKGDTEWIATGTCGIEYNLIQTAPKVQKKVEEKVGVPSGTPCDENGNIIDVCQDGVCRGVPKKTLPQDYVKRMEEIKKKNEEKTRRQLEEQLKRNRNRHERSDAAVLVFAIFMGLTITFIIVGVVAVANSMNAPLVRQEFCRVHGWGCHHGCDCVRIVECRDSWLARQMYWARQPYYDPHCMTPNYGFRRPSDVSSISSSDSSYTDASIGSAPPPQTRMENEDDVAYNTRNSNTHVSTGHGGSGVREPEEEGSVSNVQITPQQTKPASRKSSGFGGSRVRESSTAWEKTKEEKKEEDSGWGWSWGSGSSGSSSSSGWSSGFGGSSTRSSSSGFGGSSGSSKSSGFGGSRTR